MPECQSAIIRAVKFYDSSSLDEDLHVQSMCASVFLQISRVKSSDVFFLPQRGISCLQSVLVSSSLSGSPCCALLSVYFDSFPSQALPEFYNCSIFFEFVTTAMKLPILVLQFGQFGCDSDEQSGR